MPSGVEDLRTGTIQAVAMSLRAHEHVVRDYITSKVFAVSEYECIYIGLIECVYSSMQRIEGDDPSFFVRHFRTCGWNTLTTLSETPLAGLSLCSPSSTHPSSLSLLKQYAAAGDRRSFYRVFLGIPPDSLQWPLVDLSRFGPRKLVKQLELVRDRLRFGMEPSNFEAIQAGPSGQKTYVVSQSLVQRLLGGASVVIGRAVFDRLADQMKHVNSRHDFNARRTDGERLLRWYGVDSDVAMKLCTIEDVVHAGSCLEIRVSNPRSIPSTLRCTFESKFDQGRLFHDGRSHENWSVEIPSDFPQDRRL